MSDVMLAKGPEFPQWTLRRGTWILIVIHLPFVAFTPVVTITRHPDLPMTERALLALVAAAVGGLQLRHSLASVRGERPRGWPLTFAAVIVGTYVPAVWIPFSDWTVQMQWFTVASALLRAAADGITTEQIGVLLHLSPATVRNYLSNAIAKTGGRNRIDAIRIARENGWL